MTTQTIRSKRLIGLLGVIAFSANAAEPKTWTTKIDPITYAGSIGTISFNDWGYKGPRGVGANDFQVGPGFDSYRLGQVQSVESRLPDWITSDPAQTVWGDNLVTLSPLGASGSVGLTVGNSGVNWTSNLAVYGGLGMTTYPNASMDGQTNFFKFAYTSPPGQKFLNMQIDKAGNYFVAKKDMQWKLYAQFLYHDVSQTNPDKTINTTISFQPYPISNAKGWCGSTLLSNPNAVDRMAGQVVFDFALAAYVKGIGPSTQIVPNFVMRSYGDYVVDVQTATGINQRFVGSAVMNNTNPASNVPGVGGNLDPAYHNRVSFLGAGVVPAGAWVLHDNTPNVRVVPAGTPGATWHANTFAGYAFLLRADADRTLEWVSPSGHSDYVATDPNVYSSIMQ